MGAGSQFHRDVVAFFEDRFGPSQPKHYTFDIIGRVGSRAFQSDYVGAEPKCNAWVDVVHDEGWMESLGKFIVYGNELNQANNREKEFWLVFYSRSLHKKYGGQRRFKHLDEDGFVVEQRKFYSFLKRSAFNVIDQTLCKRMRVFDYDPQSLPQPLCEIE